MAFFGSLPMVILGGYLAVSIVTFIVYALDKSAARNHQWRTPESSLHLLALMGGWPGALAAQKMLRHKTSKKSFQIVFWTTAFLNCGALTWLFFSSGAKSLRLIWVLGRHVIMLA